METSKLTAKDLARMIDHTLLKQFVPLDDLKAHCQAAKDFGFKTVAVNNAVAAFCRRELEGSPVLVDAAVSFPFGQCTLETKVFETKDVISKGAGEVDYVVNLVELKSGHWHYIEEEMRQIVAACREKDITSKVIFENCFLSDDEKRRLCDIALKVRPDFIKTSTGYGAGGATLQDVKLMKSCVGDELLIKAAGGIRSAKDALAMIDAGASRIGTSAGAKIVEEFGK